MSNPMVEKLQEIANVKALMNQVIHIASADGNDRLLKVIGKASEMLEALTILWQLTEQERNDRALKATEKIGGEQ